MGRNQDKEKISDAIEEWMENSDFQSGDYSVDLLTDSIFDVVKSILKEKSFEYNHTHLRGMLFQCEHCGLSFGEWNNAFHSFTYDKIAIPGKRIVVEENRSDSLF